MLGICNGFQVLCEAGILPGALLPNVNLPFICRQVDLDVVNADTAFTRACAAGRECCRIPVKHTTGRYYAPAGALDALEDAGQVVLPIRSRGNPQRVASDIAGVTQRGRQRLGLMPHPEHAIDALTRLRRRAEDLRVMALTRVAAHA